LGYKYVAIINANTNDRLELYQDIRTLSSANVLESLYTASPYQNVTYMLDINKGNQFTLVWRDGGGTNEKRCILIFAEENPNMNFQGSDGTMTGNLTIVGDNVGLVKASQIPPSLSSGRLKVEVQDGLTVSFPPNQNVTLTNSLPTGANKIGNVDVLNEVDVEVTKPLPAGTNNIGHVSVDNFPTPTIIKTKQHGFSTNTNSTGQPLPDIPCYAVMIQSSPDNTVNLMVKDLENSGVTIASLTAGASVVITCTNASNLLVITASGTAQVYGFAEVDV